MYRSICLRASLLCCLVSCVAGPEDIAGEDPAAADDLRVAPLATTVVEFHRINTTLCLTENAPGNPQIFEGICNTTNTRQRWNWTSDGSGAKFSIQSAPTLCLDIRGASSASGTPVALNTCNGSLSQHWRITSTPLSGFLLENANSHLCVTRTSTAFVQQPCAQSSTIQNFLLDTASSTRSRSRRAR